jgi:protein O-GlcNAc transferase
MPTDQDVLEQARKHYNLGKAFKDRGQLTDAIANYREALRWLPAFPEAHNNLGVALKACGRIDEAVASYREALRLRPDFPDAHNNLGNVLLARAQRAEATACFREALRLRPSFPEAHNNLGNALLSQKDLAGALACYRQAVALRPEFVQALVNQGNVLVRLGEVAEAVVCLQRALALQPAAAQIHSHLLGAMHYLPDYDRQRLFDEHVLWGRRHAAQPRRHDNDRSPERVLRVGFLSPDFLGQHPVTFFIEPILAHRDRSRFHVTCYAAASAADAGTDRLRALADNWQTIADLSDDEAADRIASDRIDILVDLAGHTSNNRLLIFARKPAPVQVTHFGYPDTTGLYAIDYRITDAYADPPGQSEAFATERLFRLPDVAWCYQAGPAPDVGPLPARASGSITFGNLNNFTKLNARALALWSRILHCVPGSRLMLRAEIGPETDQKLSRFLAEHRIIGSRLELIGSQPRQAYLELYNRIDIALDPFPYNGGVTTCDALWMGVPVIGLAGNSYVSRQGVSLLSNLGMADWIAATEDEYVMKSKARANDLVRLQEIRSGLRQRVQLSAIGDGARFTRQLEDAYRSMWRHWCTGGEKSPP